MGTKMKRVFSVLMAFILIATIMLKPGMSVTAAEQSEKEIADTESVETEMSQAEEESLTDEQKETADKENTPDVVVDTEEKESEETETKEDIEETEEEADKSVSAEEKDKKEEAVSQETEETVETFDMPILRSLMPLPEVNAYLVLSGYSDDEIKAMPLATVLSMLRDSEGNKIEVPEDATTVWTYFKDENDDILRDEYHVIGREETVDLSIFADVTSYKMELIIGSGKQLDPGNTRYLVKVYVSNTVSEKIDYELYTQDANGNRSKVVPQKVLSSVNTQLGIPTEATIYVVPHHVNGAEYYLGISSVADEHPDLKVDVYTLMDYVAYLSGTGDNPITDQILNQNMKNTNAGYKSTYDAPAGVYDSTDNMFGIVYKDMRTGTVTNSSVICFAVKNDVSYIKGNMYDFEDQQMKDIVCFSADSYDVNWESFNIDTGSGQVSGDGVYGLNYMLKEGYPADGEYYCALDAHGVDYGDEANSYVVKAVVGLYDSLEDAKDQEDIKDELISSDRSTLPYGYKANYDYKKGGMNFTIFFEDQSVFKFNIIVSEYNPKYDEEYVQSFTDAPIIGEQDPWFRITGANQDGKPLDTYVVENGKEINMDTMYGYGYQTILINDDNVDLSKLQPTFWYANADRIEARVASDAGTKLVSGETVTDFSNGTVQYTVIIDDHQKNYQVNFVKKTKGANLYVAGPRTQEVFLDEYFEYKHDILIANTGDQPLTGLRVELDATNAKLDDYWTVGGNGNDTLAAFTETSSDTEYGELANIAKIRLLPDGDGDIEGTLKIYADGQEPVIINLTGRAQNPKIITENLEDAVKYVPYSYWISTNNMYDWTSVEYTLTGNLPEGVEWYPETGEIYGVPQESGTFPIHIEASFISDTYTFESSGVDLTLTVKENTNDNVYYASDEGYTILDSVGTDSTGTHDYVMTEITDEVFRSSGELGDFIDLWLNGQKLVKDVDYFAESGSTKITIRSQTFNNKANQNGTNTLAAEFRVGGDTSNDLKRTAQNFRLNISGDKPVTPPQPTTTPGSGNGGSTSKPATTPETNTTSQTKPNNNSSNTPSDGNKNGNGLAGSTSSEKEMNYVTLNVNVVDANDKPMANTNVEIHSTPQNAVTNESGTAKFDNVEFGTHTVTVKDANGNTIASKNFEIVSGSSLSLDGEKITAKKGSDFILKVKVDGDKLTLVGVEMSSPQTGDTSNVMLWFSFVGISIIVLLSFAVYRKRVYVN